MTYIQKALEEFDKQFHEFDVPEVVIYPGNNGIPRNGFTSEDIKSFIQFLLEEQAKMFVDGLPEEMKRIHTMEFCNHPYKCGKIDGFNSCRSETLEAWKKAELI